METLKDAFQAGWLVNGGARLQILKNRNETFHVYDEEMALRIVGNIQRYFFGTKATFLKLKDRNDEKWLG